MLTSGMEELDFTLILGQKEPSQNCCNKIGHPEFAIALRWLSFWLKIVQLRINWEYFHIRKMRQTRNILTLLIKLFWGVIFRFFFIISFLNITIKICGGKFIQAFCVVITLQRLLIWAVFPGVWHVSSQCQIHLQ